MLKMTQWTKGPVSVGASWSYMIKAKLLVPAGTWCHASGGELLGNVRWPLSKRGPAAYVVGMGCRFSKASLVRLKTDGRVLSCRPSTVGRKRCGRDGFPFGRRPRENEALSLDHRVPSMDSSFW